MNRDDFPILKSGVIYFDSGATALKPKCIVDATDEYYLKYSLNSILDNILKLERKRIENE